MTDTHDDRATDQAACPDWALRTERPTNYSNTPPGTGGGHRIQDLAVGDTTWIMSLAVSVDDRRNLWVSGRNATGHQPGTAGAVPVIRTENGILILAWADEAGWKLRERQPNRYGQEDIWVVGFPDQPTNDDEFEAILTSAMKGLTFVGS